MNVRRHLQCACKSVRGGARRIDRACACRCAACAAKGCRSHANACVRMRTVDYAFVRDKYGPCGTMSCTCSGPCWVPRGEHSLVRKHALDDSEHGALCAG
eukprot:6180213-Pleurochrysis_carterae.AAC.4